MRVGKEFENGLAAYAGVDNLFDYVQGDGCTYEQELAGGPNPFKPGELASERTGCLGDPRFDYNWGPLRGRYYYAGLGYSFDK